VKESHGFEQIAAVSAHLAAVLISQGALAIRKTQKLD